MMRVKMPDSPTNTQHTVGIVLTTLGALLGIVGAMAELAANHDAGRWCFILAISTFVIGRLIIPRNAYDLEAEDV